MKTIHLFLGGKSTEFRPPPLLWLKEFVAAWEYGANAAAEGCFTEPCDLFAKVYSPDTFGSGLKS